MTKKQIKQIIDKLKWDESGKGDYLIRVESLEEELGLK